jgi:hypothetical protein
MQRLTSRRPTGGNKTVDLKKQQSREIAAINVANKENVSNVLLGVVDNGDKAFDAVKCEMQINTVQAIEDEKDDDESTKRNKRFEFYRKELEKEEERKKRKMGTVSTASEENESAKPAEEVVFQKKI